MKNRLVRASMIVATGLFLIAALGVGVARYENRAALYCAYTMMDEADQLKVNSTTLDQVLLFVNKYGGEKRSSKPQGDCELSDCLAETNVTSLFYSRHIWLIPIVKRFGVHVFEFNVTLWIKNGKLIALEKIFFVPKSVGADVYVATLVSDPDERISGNPSYKLHPSFITSYRDYRRTPEFTYWRSASRSDETAPSARMNLDCVTRLTGCKTPAQILPAAWAQYQIDAPQIDALHR